jgi:hypothetical protein
MSDDFKPSTRKLITAMGWESERFKSVEDENYLLHRIVIDVSNRIYAALGEERFRNGDWPVDPGLVDAAREALTDHPQGYAGEDLAYLLVRAGTSDPEVLGRLHPCDRLIFRWNEQRLKASDVAAVLREGGVCDAIAAADLTRIDAWIAQPLTALGDFDVIVHALFDWQHRVVHACVRDPGYELPHDELFRQLLASAVPPVAIEEVMQRAASAAESLIDVTEMASLTMRVGESERTFRIEDDAQLAREGVRVYEHDGRGIVRFMYGGRPHGFLFEGKGTWMDVSSVLKAVDGFMAGLGRPDRAFQFAGPRGENGEWPIFLVADPARFAPAAARLGLPVSRAS